MLTADVQDAVFLVSVVSKWCFLDWQGRTIPAGKKQLDNKKNWRGSVNGVN